MTDYMHHVPGRLRVRSPRVKRNGAQAEAVRRLLAGQPGILAVETSTVTGSVTVSYDPERMPGECLLTILAQAGHVTAHTRPPAADPAGRLAERLSSVAMGMIVEKMVERSAGLLIGALI